MSIRRTCASCGFPIILELSEPDPGPANIAMHWRICEPRKNWPAYMSVKRPKPERVARVTLETEDVLRREHVVPEVSLGTFHAPCECGWSIPPDSKNAGAAMRLHTLKSKSHGKGVDVNQMVAIDG